MFAFALVVASCLSPTGLLDANHAATVSGIPPTGTLTTRYSYAGQQMRGEVHEAVDLASGWFVRFETIGPTQDAEGFDGHEPWMRDMSGAYLPEQGGNKRDLAVSRAYRNANRWWRADRGGAKLEASGCDGVRVTPPGGVPFEAWFDPRSYLLIRTREVQSFGNVAEVRYSAFAPRGNEQVPNRLDIETNDNAGDVETLRLIDYALTPTRIGSSYAMPKSKPSDWTLPPATVTVPFQLLNNHVIVEARVNGRGPFPFLVDTGGHDIVTSSTVSALGLQEQGESQATGAGEKATTSGYATVERLQVGDAVLFRQTVTKLDFSPADVEGLQLGGMIGVEFFERFVVVIDYGARTLTLIDPAHFGAVDRAHAGTPIPLTFYSHMPQVVGSFDGREGKFNIDTGSRVELSLTAPFVDEAGLRDAYPGGITITDGWGVGGPSRSYVVQAGELNLGEISIKSPIASLSSARHGAFSDASYQGNVGSGLLKRFVATFDYTNHLLYLRKAGYQDPDIGAFDRVGIWLNRADGGFRIMDIAMGGPADKGGLKAGDIVTAIDGSSVLATTLSEIRRTLKLVAVGKPLTITAQRDNVTVLATITPRDLIPR